MKIYIYNSYGDKYEINSIDYTQFNGKDTIVYLTDYSNNDGTYKIQQYTFDGWLSIEQILDELKEIIESKV